MFACLDCLVCGSSLIAMIIDPIDVSR